MGQCTRINHAIIISEAICNPNFGRAQLSTLLFECYGVPSICYGIDSMFAWHYNQVIAATATGKLTHNGII
jgi:actin-related protein 5